MCFRVIERDKGTKKIVFIWFVEKFITTSSWDRYLLFTLEILIVREFILVFPFFFLLAYFFFILLFFSSFFSLYLHINLSTYCMCTAYRICGMCVKLGGMYDYYYMFFLFIFNLRTHFPFVTFYVNIGPHCLEG